MSERGLIEGEGRGRPVLLVHGNSMSAECFAPYLEEGFGELGRAYALDLPGHGNRADDPSSASFFGHVEEVRQAARSLGSGVVVVGHSLGGHLALRPPTIRRSPR